MRVSAVRWLANLAVIALTGTLAACAEEPDSFPPAVFIPGVEISGPAEARMQELGFDLSSGGVANLGNDVCNSGFEDSAEELRAQVREYFGTVATSSPTPSLPVIDDTLADRVVAVFRGPYCDTITKMIRDMRTDG